VVVKAIGDRKDLVVVGQSFGGFTAPLIADRLRVRMLVLVAGMIPLPGEAARDYWDHIGYHDAVRRQAARDGGLTGNDDAYVLFYHDVPRDLAEQARKRARRQSSTPSDARWPLTAWPEVPTKFVLCTEDRLFPPALLRRVVTERLHIVPDEIASGHCVALSHPRELSDLLDGYAAESHLK